MLIKHYRGFLLDADNTLFDYDSAEKEAFQETLQEAAPHIPVSRALDAYRPINAGWWRRFEAGETSLDALKIGRFADLLAAIGATADAAITSRTYLERLSCKARFLPHARETLALLGRHGPLGLVTNGISLVQRGRLAAAGIDGLFAAVLISEEVGMAKPDPRFFEAACAAIGREPSEVLCIGDNPRADVEGALSAGIDACWLNPSGSPWPGTGAAPTFVVGDLAELMRAVEGRPNGRGGKS
ncbi:MAG TPA: YjjG family noncanonical pyrimidine nucleotidase [Spirochaetia bacterium]